MLLWTCALVLCVVLGALNLWWGDLNQDEGWYLYAARQVHEGRVPYRDFCFTQAPVLPFVYSAAQSWVDRWGVAGGRLFTAVLGLAGALAASWLAARGAPKGWGAFAALTAFLLLGVNVYQSHYTTVVKTYSLCALLLTGGMLALSFAGSRGGVGASLAAGLLIALAAGTRLSAGVALPVGFVYLLFRRRRLGDSRWLSFAIGGALGLALVSVPFFLMAPENYAFCVFGYHSARHPGSVASLAVYKAGFVSRFVQAYLVPSFLAIGLVSLRWAGWRREPLAEATVTSRARFNALLWAVGVAVTLVHLSAPFPYEDYQVIVVPVLAAALAVTAAAAISDFRLQMADLKPEICNRLPALFLLALLVSCAASSFSSPVNQAWFVKGRDRIWWQLKDESPIRKLREVALWLSEQGCDEGVLLTQDTYLAVESGLSVPEGMEMGPFCYYPEWPRERAERLRVLNRERMAEVLGTTRACVAAMSGYGLAIRAPAIEPLPEEEQEMLWSVLGSRYEEAFEVPDFGQALTTLRVLILRPDDAEAP